MTSTAPGSTVGWTSWGAWSGTTATARGSAHRDDQPNQDAAGMRRIPEGGLVAAVADGHGGAAHPRSAVGARLAVEAALDVLVADSDTALEALFATVVERWRRAVRGDWSSAPTDPYRAYGSTLLVARVLPDRVELAQLGDGDVVVRAGSRVLRPVPRDPSLVADTTTSLCLPTAVREARFATLLTATDVDLVLLATDGLGKSFPDPAWWVTTAEDYAVLLDRLGPATFADGLVGWLHDSAHVAGDDTTVALLRGPAPAVATTTKDEDPT